MVLPRAWRVTPPTGALMLPAPEIESEVPLIAIAPPLATSDPLFCKLFDEMLSPVPDRLPELNILLETTDTVLLPVTVAGPTIDSCPDWAFNVAGPEKV